ncbi:MAG: 4'-phosphopantetheinyl transferase superfamily protein [Clostridia bacterium]|nr:4'-phosphopantetheinyl transferase superfamily protein [Clostridia bacterium]
MEEFAKVYYADFGEFIENESLVSERLGELDEKRRQRIAKARHSDIKAQIMAGGLIIRAALKDSFGIDEFELAENEFGKPYVVGRPDVHFNISHSGKVVVCAVSDTECGVDVEDLSVSHDIMGVATRFMSVLEYDAMMMSENPNRAFCRLWTLRESYVKMRGRGFDIGLSTLKCDFHLGKAKISEQGVEQNDAFFKEIYGIIGYQAAMCTNGERESTVKRLKL